MTERTIPRLMARSIDPVADFYLALGFEITYRQVAPYQFLSVRRGGIELNFYGDKEFDPLTSAHGCLVDTGDVDVLYELFTEGLQDAFGSVPVPGIPRIGALTDMSYGVRQFLMIDPGARRGPLNGWPEMESLAIVACMNIRVEGVVGARADIR
ncbi:hypothetical protein [Mycolicibacterium vaccae]|uniref:hypothetical protein n=1 Tax=Mycolicibacterium vaccae TaxID=1810 RepID=UPI003D027BA8